MCITAAMPHQVQQLSRSFGTHLHAIEALAELLRSAPRVRPRMHAVVPTHAHTLFATTSPAAASCGAVLRNTSLANACGGFLANCCLQVCWLTCARLGGSDLVKLTCNAF